MIVDVALGIILALVILAVLPALIYGLMVIVLPMIGKISKPPKLKISKPPNYFKKKNPSGPKDKNYKDLPFWLRASDPGDKP